LGAAVSAEENEKTAARWLAREDRGLTAEEQNGLDAWLAGATNRRVAYLRLKAVWSLADRLADLPLLVVPDCEGDL
jgi:ferric-dicitrate binding protein FerR (iron transport regulator)